MAAAVQGFGPTSDIGTANSYKVVGLAIGWAGLFTEAIWKAWKCDYHNEYPAAIGQFYGELIRMIRYVPAGEALFEGGGNLGSEVEPPAFPLFTSCRLTVQGEHCALHLLEHHPEYRNIVRPTWWGR